MNKKVQTTYTTPIGELMWPFLTGKGKLKLGKDGDTLSDYEYSITIRWPINSKEAKQMLKKRDEFWEENSGSIKANYDLLKTVEDGGQEYLSLTVRTSRMVGNSGDETVLDIRDSFLNKVIFKSKKLGNGSVGRISGTMAAILDGKHNKRGVSFFLRGVQITKFKWYGVEDFEAVEDGEAFENNDAEDSIFEEEEIIE